MGVRIGDPVQVSYGIHRGRCGVISSVITSGVGEMILRVTIPGVAEPVAYLANMVRSCEPPASTQGASDGKADRGPRPLVLTGEEIQRLQGAALGILEPGPWDAAKTRLAVMTADLLRRWLADVPVFRSVPVEIISPVEPPPAAE